MSAPVGHQGAIRTIEEMRATLERGLWATETAIKVYPGDNTAYLRGKRSVLKELLERLDWPDNCSKCGKSPICDKIEGMHFCADCVSEWDINQASVDGEVA